MSSPGSAGGNQGGNNPFVQLDDTSEGVATVTIDDSDLNVIDNDAILIDDLEGDYFAIWTDYRVTNYFEYDWHRYMAGITSPDGFQGQNGGNGTSTFGTAAFFQLAAPTLFWMSDWTASRIEKAPQIPDPIQLYDKNWIILDQHYEVANVVLMRDAKTPLYRITGTYSYGHRNPGPLSNILFLMNFGRPPWINYTSIPRNVGDTVDQIVNTIDSANSRNPTAAPGAP